MAIDQTPSSSESPAAPAIDNEFPTYRAISPLAVFSLILGLASVFSFASHWFLLLTAAAMIAGGLALRKIHQFPEILTGAGIARTGFGVGMVFGCSAIAYTLAEDFSTTRDATEFAKHYIEVIKDQPVSVGLWYQQNPEYRKVKGPEDVVEELKKAKSPAQDDPYGSRAAPYVQIKNRLKVSGQEIHFSKLEAKVIDGLTIYANVLVEVDGPASKEYPTKEYGLILMIKGPGAGKNDWVVKDLRYPYTPETSKVEVEHHGSDDGHGH